MPMPTLYMLPCGDRKLMQRPAFDAKTLVTNVTFSIHLYGRRLRARIIHREPGGIPDVPR